MAATRRGSRTADVFTPYLPRLALEWAADAPDERWRVIDGSLVFIDVSGFTALSERLARRGPIGGEELTEVLGACFGELLAVAYAEGGSLLKFGGDGLLLLFDGDQHAPRAAAGAVAMRTAMRRVGQLATSVGKVRLRMSVGVHSGDLHLFRVGTSHAELIVTGPAATETVEMEATAGAGEIVVSPSTAAALDPRLIGDAKGPGFLLRDREVPRSGAGFPPAPHTRIDLAPAVPLALREHLLAGRADSEHRHATIAFVHFDGVDGLLDRNGPQAVAAALDRLVGGIQDAADTHGVTFLATDIDRDGGKVILVAGAPRARDDDEGGMLSTLRSIADAQGCLPVRIGAHRGRVFAGEIGPEYRRTYTVMGDTVNLAARLMAAAGCGQVLVTADVLTRARGEYAAEALAPFMVKGKTRPVEAFALGNRLGARRTRGPSIERGVPLVGRDKEVAALVDALEAAQQGQGQMVEITGEAGIGKSRLLAELSDHVEPAATVVVAAEPYEATTPWHLVRQMLVDALKLDADGSGARASALRARLAAIAPDLLRWLPLIADVVGAHVPPTPEVSDLEPRFRRQRTSQAVIELLDRLFPFPTLLVVEDAQWADDASTGLLRRLGEVIEDRPWLVVTTRRDGEGGFRAGDLATTVLALAPLDEDASAALVVAATADAALPVHERAELVRRAGGNPFFLQELLRVRANAGAAEELPDTVEALVATTIDRLEPADRRLLRYAAVLGVDFELGLLADVVDDSAVASAATWRRRLGDLVAVDGKGHARFRSQLVRDVAYEALPFRRRRELHGRAGDAIERAAEDAPGARAEVLSLHFLNAGRYEKCWHYAGLGASRAREKYANVEAAKLLSRALEAARYLPDLASDTVAESWELQADAWQRAGVLSQARSCYRHARRLRRSQLAALGRLYRREARIAAAEGRTTAAVRWLARGLRELEHASTRVEVSERADLEAVYGWAQQRRGRHEEALRWGAKALETALASYNATAAASAYLLLDWAQVNLGHPDEAVHTPKALVVWEERGDLSQQAFTLNAMGVFAYYRGEWDEAAALYQRALEAHRRAGNEAEAAMARYNSAEILLDLGRLDEAETTLRDVIQTYRAVGYRAGLALASRDLGRIASRRGDFDRAHSLLEEARATFVAFRAAPKVLEVEAHLADLFLRQGRIDEATASIDPALDQALSSGTATVVPLLYRLQGMAHAAAGRVEAAHAALAESLETARAARASYDVALTLEVMAAVARREGREPDPNAEHERQDLLDRLGVQATPGVPVCVSARR